MSVCACVRSCLRMSNKAPTNTTLRTSVICTHLSAMSRPDPSRSASTNAIPLSPYSHTRSSRRSLAVSERCVRASVCVCVRLVRVHVHVCACVRVYCVVLSCCSGASGAVLRCVVLSCFVCATHFRCLNRNFCNKTCFAGLSSSNTVMRVTRPSGREWAEYVSYTQCEYVVSVCCSMCVCVCVCVCVRVLHLRMSTCMCVHCVCTCVVACVVVGTRICMCVSVHQTNTNTAPGDAPPCSPSSASCRSQPGIVVGMPPWSVQAWPPNWRASVACE